MGMGGGSYNMDGAARAAAEFMGRDDEAGAAIAEYGHGIIHDTFLITPAGGDKRFILQRINTGVFKKPEAIMHNLLLVSEHIRERLRFGGRGAAANWQMLHAMAAGDGSYLFHDVEGVSWRALSLIQGAAPLEHITGLADAAEVGRGLGTFHFLVNDLEPGLLQETLPGFHNVEHYLKHYDEVLADTGRTTAPDRFCHRFVEYRRGWAPVLEIGRRRNELKVRVIHGDPKINNIMVDRKSGRAVSIIDLDTVMPGLVHYDIGDCLRSCCNSIGEDMVADIGPIRFDLGLCEAVLKGYTEAAHGFLTDTDWHFLFDAIRLLPYELGLRFYTDYLEGNRYFKVRSRRQNLARALVQFKLMESIEQQEKGIRAIIAACRTASQGRSL